MCSHYVRLQAVFRGINGQPYIDMSSVFDVSQVDSEEVCSGLAKSMRHPRDFGIVKRDGRHYFVINNMKENNSHTHTFHNTLEEQYYLHLKTGKYANYSEVAYLREANKKVDSRITVRQSEKDNSWNDNTRHFPKLVNYLKSNNHPFSEIGRVIFFISFPHSFMPTHTDEDNIKPSEHITYPKHKHEFIWFNLRNRKEFYMLEPHYDTFKKHKIKSTVAFFNDADYHCTEISNRFSVSMRIDGVFKDSVREKLGLTGLY